MKRYALLGLLLPCTVFAQVLPTLQLSPNALGTPTTNINSNAPTISPCSAQNAIGMWRMQALYELPPGLESQGFKETPERYLWLTPEGMYLGLSGTQTFTDPNVLRDTIKKTQGADVWQYTLDAKGVLYIYKNRQLSVSFHCGIASETKGGYNVGDMILTPTVRGTSQVFRHYRRPKY